MYTISQIIDLYKSIDPFVIKETEKKVKEELFNDIEEISSLNEQEIDFIIRPVVASLLMSEITKNNIQSISSINGIIESKLSDNDKYLALKKYAINLGLTPVSRTWQSLLKEIVYFIKNNWSSLKTPIINEIFNASEVPIYKIYIADSNSNEMIRNKLPLTRFPSNLLNNFTKGSNNRSSLLNNAYSRKDVEEFLLAKNATTVSLPNFIDVYMLFDVVNKTIKVKKTNNFYLLPEDMYINVKHKQKQIGIQNQDNDFFYGITNRPVNIYVVDGEEEEEFEITVYNKYIPNMDSNIINSSNILFKGFFPIFVTLDILTENTNLDYKEQLLQELRDMFKEEAFDINLSIDKINKIVKQYYPDGICSPYIKGKIYLSTNLSIEISMFLPISVKDIKSKLSDFECNQLSSNTLAIFLSDLRILDAD